MERTNTFVTTKHNIMQAHFDLSRLFLMVLQHFDRIWKHIQRHKPKSIWNAWAVGTQTH